MRVTLKLATSLDGKIAVASGARTPAGAPAGDPLVSATTGASASFGKGAEDWSRSHNSTSGVSSVST